VTNTSRFFGIKSKQVSPIHWIPFNYAISDGIIIGWHQFYFVYFQSQDGRGSTPLRKDPASSSLTTMVSWNWNSFIFRELF
jgi:hypothetical protein